MMKNITFSARDEVIEAARQQAKKEDTSLNDLFRSWLEAYVARQKQTAHQEWVEALKQSVTKASFTSDRKYTREEMNQR